MTSSVVGSSGGLALGEPRLRIRHNKIAPVAVTLLDGSPVGSGLHPYAFKIGAAGTATTLSVGGLANEYEPGATVTLTAVQTPPTGEEHYHWFVKKAGEADYTVVPGLIAGTYTFTASLDMEGAQIVVKLYNHDHGVIAESAASTLHVHQRPATPTPVAPAPPSTTL